MTDAFVILHHAKCLETDRLLLRRRSGGALRGWRRQQWVSTPRGANGAPLVPDCTGLPSTRACQMVGPALSHFLARNYGPDLAVPSRMGTYCVGSLFPNRDSHDARGWGCLRDGNCPQSSLADGGDPTGGTRHGSPVRSTSITGVSNQPDSVYRRSLTKWNRLSATQYARIAWKQNPHGRVRMDHRLRARSKRVQSIITTRPRPPCFVPCTKDWRRLPKRGWNSDGSGTLRTMRRWWRVSRASACACS